MHKPTKAKWRAFKCRNGVHRQYDPGEWANYTYCKDCGKNQQLKK